VAPVLPGITDGVDDGGVMTPPESVLMGSAPFVKLLLFHGTAGRLCGLLTALSCDGCCP